MTGWGLADNVNPLFFPPISGNGEKGWFGWATDDELEKLKGDFLKTSDDGERKELAARIQQRVYDAALFAPVGEYKPLTAYRKGVISGLVSGPVTVFWGIKKN